MPSLRTGRTRPSAMESTPRQSPPGSGTVEVLYLLSRGAKLEHPHMINVHYDVHQPGPTLRDLKARLIALRGKGMPDSFSWSYKRDYKDTFIWCDLFNDDLILPLSGSGEYVLKATKLFDVAPQADGELEYEDFPPIRYSSPSKSSSERQSSRPGEHVEDDVSSAIKKGLLLINVPPAADITSESSMGHLNKQIMNNLSNSERRVPEVICSFDHSGVSSSGTFASFGGTQSKIKRSRSKSSSGARTETRTNSSSRTGTSDSPEVANQENQCSAASQTAQDVTNLELPTIKKGEMTSTSLLRMRTPGSEAGRARRRSSVKEIDKSTVYTQFVCHKNGSDADKPQGRSPYSGSNSGDDPFLYGVLRKATRLGSNFKPRLCRGVDVVDSTRTKRKLHCRRKANGECRVKQARSVVSEPSSRKSTTVSPIKVVTGSYSCFTSPEKPNMKGFKTLSHESFERTNSNSPTPVDKLINEPHPSSIEDHTPRPSTQLGLAQEDSSTTDLPRESDLPRLPFGNDSMEVVPTSRGACRVHTMPQREGLKSVRSESKGNKQEVKLDSKSSSKVSSASNSRQAAPKPSYEHDGLLHHACSIHGMDDPMVVSPEVSARNVNLASKQRKPLVKKASVTSFDASSARAKATGKGSDERTVKAPRNASKESASNLQLTIVEDSTKQVPESFAFDSRALRSGNKQGLKMATQVPAMKTEVKASAEATPKINSSEGSRRCPFEPPARPRDFKSREDRPLIPGLSSKDWERSLQEACRHSEPPTNLVLHECPQCGRTFKLESLQVHMRGCHAVSKPKPSSATQRRISL